MTTQELRLWQEGRDLSAEYMRLSGNPSLRPNRAVIEKMARLLDLKRSYITKCLAIFNYR